MDGRKREGGEEKDDEGSRRRKEGGKEEEEEEEERTWTRRRTHPISSHTTPYHTDPIPPHPTPSHAFRPFKTPAAPPTQPNPAPTLDSWSMACACLVGQLRLYKLVFGSVALFAEQDPANSNEPILQPHLGGIIKTSLKVSRCGGIGRFARYGRALTRGAASPIANFRWPAKSATRSTTFCSCVRSSAASAVASLSSCTRCGQVAHLVGPTP